MCVLECVRVWSQCCIGLVATLQETLQIATLQLPVKLNCHTYRLKILSFSRMLIDKHQPRQCYHSNNEADWLAFLFDYGQIFFSLSLSLGGGGDSGGGGGGGGGGHRQMV